MPRHQQAHDVLITIDRSRRALVGRQIEDQLRAGIRSGRLTAGGELPSTRSLADALSVSRGVIERAYAQLSAEGYIDLRQGANPRVHRRMQASSSAGPRRARSFQYDLRPHMPDVGVFPRHSWQRSFDAALSAASDADLGYSDPVGLEQLRVQLAEYLGRARGVSADPSRIVVTSGSTQSISLIARTLAQSRRTSIGFENPSQRSRHAVAERAGLQVTGIDVDADGLDVGQLSEHTLDAIVTAPAHQFPTGAALSESRRAALLEWAAETGGLVIEDEYDADFRYDRPPVGALQGRAPDNVVYLGSTSKTLAPSLRLGWAVLPDALVASVRDELELSILQVPALLQLTFTDFLKRGEFDRHVRKMRGVYRRRRDALVRALEDRLEEPAIGGVAAGLHLVLALRSFEEETRVAELAHSRLIALETLSDHGLPGYAGPPGLLMGYGAISEAAIPHVVAEIADMIEQRAPRHAPMTRR